MNIIQRQGQQRNRANYYQQPLEERAVELGKMASSMIGNNGSEYSSSVWYKYRSLYVNAGETIKAHVGSTSGNVIIAKVSEDGTLISNLASATETDQVTDVTYTATESCWVCIYNRSDYLATPTVTVTSRGSDWNDSRYHK